MPVWRNVPKFRIWLTQNPSSLLTQTAPEAGGTELASPTRRDVGVDVPALDEEERNPQDFVVHSSFRRDGDSLAAASPESFDHTAGSLVVVPRRVAMTPALQMEPAVASVRTNERVCSAHSPCYRLSP